MINLPNSQQNCFWVMRKNCERNEKSNSWSKVYYCTSWHGRCGFAVREEEREAQGDAQCIRPGDVKSNRDMKTKGKLVNGKPKGTGGPMEQQSGAKGMQEERLGKRE